MENRRNILMDCDPGIDDAAALCVAAAHPEAFRILGISTVAGNQTIETVTENALRLTQFFGLDVPVAQGAKVPLTRPAKTAADIHGKNGLGDVEIPKTDRKAVSDNAVVFLREDRPLTPEVLISWAERLAPVLLGKTLSCRLGWFPSREAALKSYQEEGSPWST